MLTFQNICNILVDTLMCFAAKTSNEVSSVASSDLKTEFEKGLSCTKQASFGSLFVSLFDLLWFDLFSKHLKFKETNLVTLQQFSALAQMHRLEQLTVDPQGNPVVSFALWKYYVLFRLNHFNLQKINGVKVGQCCVLLAIGLTR